MVDSPTVKGRPSNHGLGTLVGGYMRRKIQRGVHPAFDAFRSEELALFTRVLVEVLTISRNDLSVEATHERERFQAALVAYGKTIDGAKFRTDLIISDQHTWEDVLAEVNKASEVYNSDSRAWNKIRKGFHKFGDNNKAFDSWLGLLPSGSDWSSVLSGGLKLIVRASARLADMRQEILSALTEIPSLLTCINRVLKIFETSEELRQWALELYISTIGILHHIVNWYSQNSIVKAAKAVLKQESYGMKLSSLIQDLREKSTRFDKSAQISSFEMGKETNMILLAHDIQSRDDQEILVGRLDQIQLKTTDNQREVNLMKAQISNLTEAICRNFLAGNGRVDFKTRQVRGPILPASNAAIRQRTLKRTVHLSNQSLAWLEANSQRAEYLKARDDCLEALNYDNLIIARDISTSLREVWRISRIEQDRIATIIQSTKLSTWIITSNSSALFINCNSSGDERVSSFTFAKLVESITAYDNHQVIALSFFCGAHRRREDRDTGVVGLMRSLISQLLIAYPEFSLKTLDQIPKIQLADVSALCQVFHRLIHELPSDTLVFCIIESVTTFETGTALLEESILTVSKLVEIVQETDKYSCIFKLLFSSPRNSQTLHKLMPDRTSDVVWIPNRVQASGGFTFAKWQADVGERMDWLNQ
ncbi:hypothetical protein N7466_001821 [Penicillium verhagenii]|uniref:uncharacterized protein n=1 Tax=Penicillium verhagenii TaxID=1562060 RepID=UPI002544D557|nr:uncharacterized protein N7466_001821 [Penicillium verhagenii]KAJ5938687.1 hypothetical protein N7466_001821 [Penicillium verhagenii]